ncbi:GNAT family N-acetyltransferase [Streptomyces sp. NPDC094149]|uniref:GNAT family N-acetyltransferase n=1 Tax=Streptomyces sp. NPDC094149 TaxID=3155079 RepID=UPI00332464D0
MERITALLTAPATPSAPALTLRPWEAADAPALLGLRGDEALRRWTNFAVEDEDGAASWVREQRRGWETGERFAFAVAEAAADGTDGDAPVGHVVLKRPAPGAPSAEVGYWTAARARGRAVAPRALEALTDWAFAVFAADGLARLELVHQTDNTASCAVARKCRYELTAVLPAEPPAFPRDGHVHVRTREAWVRGRTAPAGPSTPGGTPGDRRSVCAP